MRAPFTAPAGSGGSYRLRLRPFCWVTSTCRWDCAKREPGAFIRKREFSGPPGELSPPRVGFPAPFRDALTGGTRPPVRTRTRVLELNRTLEGDPTPVVSAAAAAHSARMTTLDTTSAGKASLHEFPRTSSSDLSPRRVAACAAACEGIPTHELENGIVFELVAACVRLRDDERLREILLRLSPAKPRPVRSPARLVEREDPATETPNPSDFSVAVLQPIFRPLAEVPAPTAAPEEALPDALSSQPSPTAEPAGPQTASEKFRLGLRVRISARGIARMRPTVAQPTGFVQGFSKSSAHVRITRDGRTSSECFHMDDWEEDPDYRDLNESIASGFRASVRSASARRHALPKPRLVFLPGFRRSQPSSASR